MNSTPFNLSSDDPAPFALSETSSAVLKPTDNENPHLGGESSRENQLPSSSISDKVLQKDISGTKEHGIISQSIIDSITGESADQEKDVLKVDEELIGKFLLVKEVEKGQEGVSEGAGGKDLEVEAINITSEAETATAQEDPTPSEKLPLSWDDETTLLVTGFHPGDAVRHTITKGYKSENAEDGDDEDVGMCRICFLNVKTFAGDACKENSGSGIDGGVALWSCDLKGCGDLFCVECVVEYANHKTEINMPTTCPTCTRRWDLRSLAVQMKALNSDLKLNSYAVNDHELRAYLPVHIDVIGMIYKFHPLHRDPAKDPYLRFLKAALNRSADRTPPGMGSTPAVLKFVIFKIINQASTIHRFLVNHIVKLPGVAGAVTTNYLLDFLRRTPIEGTPFRLAFDTPQGVLDRHADFLFIGIAACAQNDFNTNNNFHLLRRFPSGFDPKSIHRAYNLICADPRRVGELSRIQEPLFESFLQAANTPTAQGFINPRSTPLFTEIRTLYENSRVMRLNREDGQVGPQGGYVSNLALLPRPVLIRTSLHERVTFASTFVRSAIRNLTYPVLAAVPQRSVTLHASERVHREEAE